MSQNLSPSGSTQSHGSSGPRLASFEKVRVMANYLELSALEYIQRCSSDSGLQLDDSTMPLFYILSCWKLLWCLSINELIGESLRNMIEESFTFRTDIGNTENGYRKLLSIPEMTEGEVSRYAMAYSPIFRVVLGVLRWLRWESRVNPYKQNDIVFKDTYYMDYPESRILWKNLGNHRRFYSLDWALNVDKSAISQSDREDVEEVFKVAFMLLRKGCRMHLDTFLRERAKAHWLICLMDGMDSYLYPEKQSDHFVDLSNFIEILPKVDDMWINYNEGDDEMELDVVSAGAVGEGQFMDSMSSINKELALNDTLFKASFEFVDLMERSLIFPAFEDSPNSGSEIEGNINRPLLFRFLRQLVSENRKMNPKLGNKLGEWELSFYSILCGDFEQLYSMAGDDFDKLFALFHTEKTNIFNGWADFLESRTQSGRNHIFLGKTYPKKKLENALLNRLELLTRDLYPELTGSYLPEDCESISEYNLIKSIQTKIESEYTLGSSEDDETHIIGYNSSCFCYDQDTKGVVNMMELERQLIDSLIDSIMCLNFEKDKTSIESHFFQVYLGIIVSTLNTREHGSDLIQALEEFMNYISTLSNDTPTLGSLKAFISQMTVAHLEIESSLKHDIRNYSVSIFDEFILASLPSMDYFDTLEPSQASIQLEVLSDSISIHPLHNLSESLKDRFVSQYLSYILENNNRSLDVFLIMIEYSSETCRLEYIRKVLSTHQNNLDIPSFQKLVYNLINQFPRETMQVTMALQDQIYGEIHTLLGKDEGNSPETLDFMISYLEFIILLFGTIFQFLIIRQDYSPSSESIFRVLQYINHRHLGANGMVNHGSDYLRESLRSLEQSLLSESPCNQTTSEVVIGLFFLSQLNPLCLLLLALEVTKLSGSSDIDTLEYHQFLLNVTRSNACVQEFIIPLVLEPIMIRLITVLVSNSDNIGPNYSKYKVSKLMESKNLQALNWEQSLANIFSIGNFIYVQNVFISFSPIRFLSSQLTFFKVLGLFRVYHDSVERLWECVKLLEQEAFQNENLQFGVGNSGKQREPLQSPVISPGNSLLSSPFNKYVSPASNTQRRSSLQILNIDRQIEGANQSISQVISKIEIVLQNWLVFGPNFHSSLLENFGDKESQEISKTETFSLSGFLPEYCSFDKSNFGLETFSVQHCNNKELLKRSRFINIQKLFDQLILTIIFHRDIELFSTKKAPLFPRRSIDSTKGQQQYELKSVSFLNNILGAIEHSNWIFTDFE
ncbi:uncharacterized protein cubi_03232 [Cryptosporidium ubiquitum]|uniref:Uncharacterized protein n=1 Tax=Cryptosporidium ubiquitum TaxID=857276 RepID=A0A1J4M9N9_9CRYT|nr:uncharacterized protein cubi_03232 [Cryptosporidium ubiquitum]OII70934.1 hypothetical protein cubi_03232 [Cryptosporidium ubiquitum]